MSDFILKVECLSKEFYLHEQEKVVPSARDVTFEVHCGCLTALTGRTGCGKSSVLKMIYRTYLPTRGRIILRTAQGAEVDLCAIDDHHILELRRREMGFVTQFFHPLPRQSTLDVVAQPLFHLGVPRREGHERAGELLALLDIPRHLWSIPPATFSGGEKQRVNLARGIIARPRLLMLDEPTASLDPSTVRRVVKLLSSLKEEKIALLAIFHDMRLVDELADSRVSLAVS